MSELDWAIPLLVCPRCRGPLLLSAGNAADGYLTHRTGRCDERYPIIGGIPRLLLGAHRARLIAERADWFDADAERRSLAAAWRSSAPDQPRDVVGGFDYEWRRFSSIGTPELRTVAAQYFDIVPEALFAGDQVALDAGCGAGRWAYETAARGARVIAVDLGLSVEVARRNTESTGRVLCVQADLRDLPLRDGAVDWAYSLGVIHHISDSTAALTRLVCAVRAMGAVLLYVYYDLDGRGVAYRVLFRASDGVRRVVSRLPRGIAHPFASLVALTVYWPLARFSAITGRLGLERVSRSLPLSFYRDLSLEVMRNDSLDRFGTRLEKRYKHTELLALMQDAGLRDIRVSPLPPFWHAIGIVGEGSEVDRALASSS